MQIKKNIYLVGGAVRDKLLGYPISDKDYVAVGYSEADFTHLPKVGKDFSVFLQEDGSELALARVERKTSHGYNGFEAQIKNVTLEDDLKRRDLTINSIAYDEKKDIYIDPFNGRDDIKNKVLRHTSFAFVEDPLRVVRVARLRAKLGIEWNIDATTKKLIVSMKNELQFLQPDRVYKEIKKVFENQNPYLFFQTLIELDVIDKIFPSIALLQKEELRVQLVIELLKRLQDQPMQLQLSAIYSQVIQINKEFIIDISLPKKTKQYIELFLQSYSFMEKIELYEDKKLVDFFTKLKGNKEILQDILYFHNILIDVTMEYNKEDLKRFNSDGILDLFYKICSYSPKDWIESFVTKPSNQKIISHLQNHNLQILRSYKQLSKKPFIL